MLSKKIIERILVCTMTMISIGNVGNIFASEKSSNFTKEFLEASDDTIVCYMEGMPITKSQIDQNGFINEETLDEI